MDFLWYGVPRFSCDLRTCESDQARFCLEYRDVFFAAFYLRGADNIVGQALTGPASKMPGPDSGSIPYTLLMHTPPLLRADLQPNIPPSRFHVGRCIPMEVVCGSSSWGRQQLALVSSMAEVLRLKKITSKFAPLSCLGIGGKGTAASMPGLMHPESKPPPSSYGYLPRGGQPEKENLGLRKSAQVLHH